METYEEFINNILETRGRFNCGDEYHERHHIVPKCMNGTDSEDNLIDLFAREHFIAHKMLALENPDNDSLIHAWWMMAHGTKREYQDRYEATPEEYEEARIAAAQAISRANTGRKVSEEQRKATSDRFRGVPKSEEHRKKISESSKGKTYSEETLRKMSERQIGGKSPRARKIIQYDLSCNYIRTWDCIKDASDALGIKRQGINRCCQKDQWYKQCGGFIWRYIEEPLTESEIQNILNDGQKIRGVYYDKRYKKWYAKFGDKYLGSFATKEEAIAKRVVFENYKLKTTTINMEE